MLNPGFEKIDLRLSDLVLHRGHRRLLFVGSQSIKSRRIEIPGNQDLSAAAPGHGRLEVLEGQPALFGVVVMARRTVLPKDGLDVVFVSDLRWLLGPKRGSTSHCQDGSQSTASHCGHKRIRVDAHRISSTVGVDLVIENELAAIENRPEHILKSLIRIARLADHLHEPSSLSLSGLAG